MGRKNKSKFSGKKTSLQDFQGAQSTGTVRKIEYTGKNVVVTIKDNLTRIVGNKIAEVKYSDSGKNESCENYPTNRPSSKAQTSIFNVENSSRVRDCSSKHENVENAPSERAAEDKCWRDQNSSHRRDSESRNGYVQRASNNMERKTRNGPPSYMDVTEDKHEANQSRRNSSNERKDRHSQMASSNMEQKNRNEQHSHTYDNKVTKDKYEANQSRRNSSSERKDWHIQVSDYSDNSNVAENIETDILESDPRNANWRNRNSDKSSTSNAGESNQAWEIPKHSNRQRASNPPRDNKMEHSRRHFNEDQRSNDDRRDREPKQKGQRNHTRWGPLDESKFSKTSNVYPGEYSQTNNYGKYPRHSDNGADMKYSYNKAVSPEYEEFLEWKKHFAHELKCTISEKNGDLFTAPAEYSLCHCVAEDLRMGSGIAVTFRQTFGKVAELLQQGKQTGEVAVLTDKGRFIYYLVTKEFSNGKPTNDTLLQSLLRLKEHMSAHNVTKLAMPTIGCGLDKLRWEDVQDMLQYVFKDSAVEIVVYLFEQSKKFNHFRGVKKTLLDFFGGKVQSSGTVPEIIYNESMNQTVVNDTAQVKCKNEKSVDSKKRKRRHHSKSGERGRGGKIHKDKYKIEQSSDEARHILSGHRARDDTSLHRDHRSKHKCPNKRSR